MIARAISQTSYSLQCSIQVQLSCLQCPWIFCQSMKHYNNFLYNFFIFGRITHNSCMQSHTVISLRLHPVYSEQSYACQRHRQRLLDTDKSVSLESLCVTAVLLSQPQHAIDGVHDIVINALNSLQKGKGRKASSCACVVKKPKQISHTKYILLAISSQVSPFYCRMFTSVHRAAFQAFGSSCFCQVGSVAEVKREKQPVYEHDLYMHALCGFVEAIMLKEKLIASTCICGATLKAFRSWL